MNQHIPAQAISLFDLIARSWAIGTDIQQICFNTNESALACLTGEGQVSTVAMADAEAPENRMRMELETGRMTIRPREQSLPPATPASPVVIANALAPLGEQGFAAAAKDGELWRITARGQALRIAEAAGAITTLCGMPGGVVCVARGAALSLTDGEGVLAEVALNHTVQVMAVSADGTALAAWGKGRFTLLSPQLEVLGDVPSEGEVITLQWSPDKAWLVAGCADKVVVLLDLQTMKADRIVDFPAPVHSIEFDAASGDMLASGAFRVVGWRGPNLPFGTHKGDPIETGKAGLTIVERLAMHPQRDLCAVGYANGLVAICRVAEQDELMLLEGQGAAVRALCWTRDAAHMGIALADGKVAIVTFPKNMFK